MKFELIQINKCYIVFLVYLFYFILYYIILYIYYFIHIILYIFYIIYDSKNYDLSCKEIWFERFECICTQLWNTKPWVIDLLRILRAIICWTCNVNFAKRSYSKFYIFHTVHTNNLLYLFIIVYGVRIKFEIRQMYSFSIVDFGYWFYNFLDRI